MNPWALFLAFVAGMIVMFFIKNAAIKAAHKGEAEALRLLDEARNGAHRAEASVTDEAQRVKDAAKSVAHL